VGRLALERLPVPGVPDSVVLKPGDRLALVVPQERHARRLADLLAGLDMAPVGVAVRCSGRVRLVPAEGGLLPYLTVLGNLVHGARTSRDVPRRKAEEESREAASWCGLDDVLDRYPYEITPGRRRLAGIARALRGGPTAIVLEDAAGLPTWGSLLDFEHNPQLFSAVLLLITPDRERASGFPLLEPGGAGA